MGEEEKNIRNNESCTIYLPPTKIKGDLQMANMDRNVWEGWTPKDFIDALDVEIDMIMTGNSWRKPFQTREALITYIVDNQPYYKKPIEEVNNYFIEKYNL